MADLKPCPFCGGDAELVHMAITAYDVRCGTPGCYGNNPEFSKDGAVVSWNTRAAERAGGGVDVWQPIETAPRDGTMFLCWVSAVRYGEDENGQQYSADVSEVDFGHWRRCEVSGGYYENMMGQIGDLEDITHWMPLPARPTALRADGEGRDHGR